MSEDNKICPIMNRPTSDCTGIIQPVTILCQKESCMAWVVCDKYEDGRMIDDSYCKLLEKWGDK